MWGIRENEHLNVCKYFITHMLSIFILENSDTLNSRYAEDSLM